MIDLRSDTVTRPSAAMRHAMAQAEVGDDVYREDPTVLKLEETAAEMLGKEAALFVTSGTQGNQIAVLTHARPGDEVILEAESHIFYYEVGAMAALAGVQARTLPGVRGQMPLSQLKKAIRGVNIHYPETKLICLENTHNRAGGAILPLSYMKEVYELAQAHQVPVHLDGARLFNAAVASGIAVREFAAAVDTVQVCLSKGLGAPIGSLLAGSREWIERARKWRKALGGGMRQAGVIAAPGLLALNTMVDRLADDHRRAKRLAEGLAQIPGVSIRPEDVETNIVIADISGLSVGMADFLQRLAKESVLATDFSETTVRFVTHVDVDDAAIEATLLAVSRSVSA
ncbi:low-specificity L-threonine aldolase [Ferroacidibacillus organovorans]|uniref:Threonine aldolase n=1 Tax=Ferroacidibacillus organovorans TaxID=1765683 RepID=A0A162T8R3_9BACL|nr:low-specificity L-threonine aldolase [Ferroacidibacillus organovorans]KYP80572.1 threonine aldolase [Ferroacidibacillus organovorans]OAG93459.1 threonine aldolase [Ferroacidibacillus organovorans]OPG17072.1 low-specificity L-threonine aldolase [Ferroacidibacillus organovorans]